MIDLAASPSVNATPAPQQPATAPQQAAPAVGTAPALQAPQGVSTAPALQAPQGAVGATPALQAPQRVVVSDLRKSKMCLNGSREFAKRHGLDWRDFVKNGIAIEILEAIDDAMAHAVVEVARGRRR